MRPSFRTAWQSGCEGSAGEPSMAASTIDSNLGTEERLNEVARLLALGYLRFRERQRANHPDQLRKLGVDFSDYQWMCVANADARGESKG